MLHGDGRIVKHKIGLLNLAEELSNVSRACKIMRLSRDTFYRYKAAVEDGGIDALIDKNWGKLNKTDNLRLGTITKRSGRAWDSGRRAPDQAYPQGTRHPLQAGEKVQGDNELQPCSADCRECS